LDSCLVNSTILVEGGIYRENIVISKGVTIMPVDEKESVIIVANKGPTITVDVEK
jgi:hypothetical protein